MTKNMSDCWRHYDVNVCVHCVDGFFVVLIVYRLTCNNNANCKDPLLSLSHASIRELLGKLLGDMYLSITD